MNATLRKWQAVFGIFLQESLAYRASGVIWIMTDCATAVTLPLVWASAARNGPIQGFQAKDFVLYYLCMLFLQGFVTSHIMWEIATEIKEGQFAPMLLRPVSYFQYTFFRSFAWRVVRPVIFAPFYLLILFAYRQYLGGVHLNFSWEFFVSVALGHMVSMTFVTMMACLAFFVQEAFSIFELYYVPMLFLSGQLFPLSMMPHWVQNIRWFFPFYFTTGAPTEILIGRIQGGSVYQTLLVQLAWVAFSYAMYRVLFAKGVKVYNAVGL